MQHMPVSNKIPKYNTIFFYKNELYIKNIEAEFCKFVRIF